MENLGKLAKHAYDYLITFVKWLLISAVTGTVGGVVGAVFHLSVDKATEFRTENSYIIYFLPIVGVLIVLIYKLLKLDDGIGTNDILIAVRKKEKGVPFLLAPAIFASTVLTHLCGGSSGREGAALQLGGSIASAVGKIFKVGEKDFPLVLMCGMAAVFSALFLTPLTAAFFAMEVISVGIIYYSALVPTLCAALVGYKISIIFGAVPLDYCINVPIVNFSNSVSVGVLAAACALLSIVFCVAMHGGGMLFGKFVKNSYLRAAIGGMLVLAMTFACGTYDYNGAGMGVVDAAIAGQAVPEAFLLKMIFTAITIGSGFKGGEIVPAFFIGSSFGCVVGSLLGLDAGFSAAIGLVALFCGVVNCPAASIFLSVELFGSEGILFFAAACAVSYFLSGYSGLYSGQKIVYSKLKAEYINIHAK